MSKHKGKHHHRKDGGKMDEKAHPHEYNAKGSPEAKEAMDEKDSFKRGGKKRAHGGSVHGEKSAHRLDKRARGGRMGGGESPFSAAHKGEMPGKQSSGKGSGHESEQPSDSMDD